MWPVVLNPQAIKFITLRSYVGRVEYPVNEQCELDNLPQGMLRSRAKCDARMLCGLRRKTKKIAITCDDDAAIGACKFKVGLVTAGPKAAFDGCRNLDTLAAQLGGNSRRHVLVKMESYSLTHALAPAAAA
jgi:hypothetical protein